MALESRAKSFTQQIRWQYSTFKQRQFCRQRWTVRPLTLYISRHVDGEFFLLYYWFVIFRDYWNFLSVHYSHIWLELDYTASMISGATAPFHLYLQAFRKRAQIRTTWTQSTNRRLHPSQYLTLSLNKLKVLYLCVYPTLDVHWIRRVRDSATVWTRSVLCWASMSTGTIAARKRAAGIDGSWDHNVTR